MEYRYLGRSGTPAGVSAVVRGDVLEGVGTVKTTII